METAGATAGEKRSEHGSIPETLGPEGRSVSAVVRDVYGHESAVTFGRFVRFYSFWRSVRFAGPTCKNRMLKVKNLHHFVTIESVGLPLVDGPE
jgi:hypothetical protein